MLTSMSRKIVIVSVLALLSLLVGTAWAQEADPSETIPFCSGTSVTGTIVGVSEEDATVTIYTSEGLCRVQLVKGTYDHPIVNLLGQFFDHVSAQTLLEALSNVDTEICVVPGAEEGEWLSVSCDVEGAQEATVISENSDGTFTAVLKDDGQEELIGVIVADDETAENLRQELASVSVSWHLKDDGSLVQSGDQIAYYHDQGIGFGVLVKLSAMAEQFDYECRTGNNPEACEISLEDLIQSFQEGTGLGEMFKIYGKPELLGVGHVRKAMNDHEDMTGEEDKWAETDNPGKAHPAGQKDKDKGKDKATEGSESNGENNGKSPDHAQNKDKGETGSPDHAGPKDKDKNNGNSSDKGKKDK
jgi:hypothetical protein